MNESIDLTSQNVVKEQRISCRARGQTAKLMFKPKAHKLWFKSWGGEKSIVENCGRRRRL